MDNDTVSMCQSSAEGRTMFVTRWKCYQRRYGDISDDLRFYRPLHGCIDMQMTPKMHSDTSLAQCLGNTGLWRTFDHGRITKKTALMIGIIIQRIDDGIVRKGEQLFALLSSARAHITDPVDKVELVSYERIPSGV